MKVHLYDQCVKRDINQKCNITNSAKQLINFGQMNYLHLHF